jgi:Cellulase (glycosyl hydrolase family 5)
MNLRARVCALTVPLMAAFLGTASATVLPTHGAGVRGSPATPARGGGRPVRIVRTGLNGIHVLKNALVDGSGNVIHLQGVNRSGTEYACIQGWGIFDGPSDANSVAAIASWNTNIVRVLLNEDCWLDINGVNQAYAGANYQSAIVNYVNLLHSYGMYAEISLIWAAPGDYQATYQPAAPDEDHSPAMWSSMASTFKNDPNVILAPWGETTVGWHCFMRKGCDNQATYGPQNKFYKTAPMQQAVTLMRAAGYNGVISIPCIDYANACGKINGSDYDGSTWLKAHPSDPDNQEVAEAHVYGKNTCDTTACFDSSMKPITKTFPLIFGETGETYDGSDCTSSYISTFMGWADQHGVGYEAWTWDTWGGCGVLISDYNGTPASQWAQWVQTHYLAQ